MVRRALITGITGQDGVYLAELLLSLGYEVHGASHSSVDHQRNQLGPLFERVRAHSYQMADPDSLRRLVVAAQPCEIYHLAGPSFIPECAADPPRAGELLGLVVVRLLQIVHDVDPTIRFFQAGSSELFGNAVSCPQNEMTPLAPRTVYGVAKGFAHQMVRLYREQRGLFACSGILYNHESPRRSEQFVTRKISRAVARIKHGLQGELLLGDLEARRDWGFAGDYVRAMHLILKHDRPDDYVIATGRQHSVRELCDLAFRAAGLDYRAFVKTDPVFQRPGDPHRLCGDPRKARETLGWEPRVPFADWVREMVEADLRDLGMTTMPPQVPHGRESSYP